MIAVLKSFNYLIHKYRWYTFTLILLQCICFLLLGSLFISSKRAFTYQNDYSLKYEDKKIYHLSETLNDYSYISYLDDANEVDYNNLKSFIYDLHSFQTSPFISLYDQPVFIYNTEIPKQFLYSYEEGYGDQSVMEYENKTIQATKSFQVSEHFFDTFQIKISEGDSFNSESYIYHKDSPIPVLLGSEYKKYFSIGDVFQCLFLQEYTSLEVIGFLEENCFSYLMSQDDLVSCNRYIILPALEIDDSSEFAKELLLQQTYGVFVTEELFSEVDKKVKNQKIKNSLDNWDIALSDPSQITQSGSIFEKYTAMTQEVSKQYTIILYITCGLTFVVTLISIIKILSSSTYYWGVQILCGASSNYIRNSILLFVSYIYIISDAISSLVIFLLKSASWRDLLFIHIMSAGYISLATLFFIFYLKKMKLTEIIGGKE